MNAPLEDLLREADVLYNQGISKFDFSNGIPGDEILDQAIDDIRNANSIYRQVSEEYPDDCRAWVGLMQSTPFIVGDEPENILLATFSGYRAAALKAAVDKESIDRIEHCYQDVTNRIKTERQEPEATASPLQSHTENTEHAANFVLRPKDNSSKPTSSRTPVYEPQKRRITGKPYLIPLLITLLTAVCGYSLYAVRSSAKEAAPNVTLQTQETQNAAQTPPEPPKEAAKATQTPVKPEPDKEVAKATQVPVKPEPPKPLKEVTEVAPAKTQEPAKSNVASKPKTNASPANKKKQAAELVTQGKKFWKEQNWQKAYESFNSAFALAPTNETKTLRENALANVKSEKLVLEKKRAQEERAAALRQEAVHIKEQQEAEEAAQLEQERQNKAKQDEDALKLLLGVGAVILQNSK